MTSAIAFEERIDRAHAHADRLRAAIGEVIVGQADVVDQVLWGLIAGGHVLLEGNPGLGKTLLVRTLSSCLSLRFSRIQFTPDLMPSDVTGTNVLLTDPGGRSAGRFEFSPGPIFAQIVLADEINRATPKTQSALLEAMQEHAVTVAGKRYALEQPFFVLATENPIEMEGTYPLPEAQLDRFLLKTLVPNPGEDEMSRILERTTGHELSLPQNVLDAAEVLELRALCRDIAVAAPVLDYAARLVASSQPESPRAPELVRRSVRYGAGVRGGQGLVLAAKAIALLAGRAQISFGDVARAALPVLRHRLILSFEGEADGVSTDSVIKALLESVPTLPAAVQAAVRES